MALACGRTISNHVPTTEEKGTVDQEVFLNHVWPPFW